MTEYQISNANITIVLLLIGAMVILGILHFTEEYRLGRKAYKAYLKGNEKCLKSKVGRAKYDRAGFYR